MFYRAGGEDDFDMFLDTIATRDKTVTGMY